MTPLQSLFPTPILLLSVCIIGTSHALLFSPLHHSVNHHHHRRTIQTKTNALHSSPRIQIQAFSTAPSSTAVTRDDDILCKSNKHDAQKNSNNNNEQLIKELGSAFAQKLFELEDYQRKNGHCLVPKRYESNPSLGNWVNKQRQNYRKFVKGEKTSMNEKRISALNEIGFVWNASATPVLTRNEIAWREMYNQLSQFHATNGHCRVPSASPLGQWVVRQRFLYRQYPSSATGRSINKQRKSSLTDERIQLLNDLNFPWTTRSEMLWETRTSELREFKKQNGHVMVPRKYPPNPQLSAWVATQRKNYNRRQAGKPSPLTLERIKELEDIGFVWSYWDYNFMANNSA